jgi:hypothetical protein
MPTFCNLLNIVSTDLVSFSLPGMNIEKYSIKSFWSAHILSIYLSVNTLGAPSVKKNTIDFYSGSILVETPISSYIPLNASS